VIVVFQHNKYQEIDQYIDYYDILFVYHDKYQLKQRDKVLLYDQLVYHKMLI